MLARNTEGKVEKRQLYRSRPKSNQKGKLTKFQVESTTRSKSMKDRSQHATAVSVTQRNKDVERHISNQENTLTVNPRAVNSG